jgi:hypothetical protein
MRPGTVVGTPSPPVRAAIWPASTRLSGVNFFYSNNVRPSPRWGTATDHP